ncbi:hypothetical protein P3L10_030552 [Capsicum annuum]
MEQRSFAHQDGITFSPKSLICKLPSSKISTKNITWSMKYGLIFLLINTQKLEIPQIILKSHPLQSKIVPKLTYNSNSCKTSSDTSVDKKVEEKSFATAEVATLMAPEGDDASHHTQIPSNESLPKLPQELITAILVRLPVKSLLQFKSVSKEWFALISSPHFRNVVHLSTFLDIVLLALYFMTVTETFDLDYPVKQPKRIVRVLGSVNGFNFYRIWFNSLVLWNPSTGKYKQLPDLMPTQMVTTGYCFNYGFGYDEVHNDYKIVALFREISKHCVDAKIYSLKSDSWRILDDAQGEMLYDGSGKLVNGKLHWVTIVDGGWSIMSIDMVDEKCRKVEQPYYGVDQFSLTLGVLGSDMCVLCSHERTDVWVMKDYGVKESWTKMYTIKSPK